MVVIGLTGGILSGKSTISGMLAEKGAVIIDADEIGHEAYEPGTGTWQELRDAFGDDILRVNGEIDRKRLGEIVFADRDALPYRRGGGGSHCISLRCIALSTFFRQSPHIVEGDCYFSGRGAKLFSPK